jgi:hypothetical protein
MAQSASQLNGSVSDPSAAIVAGAKITLTEEATGCSGARKAAGESPPPWQLLFDKS